jgi:phosphoribosylformylglycinamidine cyclo-ligase
VGFEINHLIEPHPVFSIIQRLANVADHEMYEVFNMGIGFCYIVDPKAVEATLAILRKHDRHAKPIGYAIADPEKRVRIPERGLVGKHKTFRKDDRMDRKAG